MRTCIFLKDNKWLLGILDIDNLKNINDTIGYNNANKKIITLGRIIKEFCDEKPLKTKGFKFNNKYNNNNNINTISSINNKADMFAILLRYSKKVENVERRLKNLMNEIENILNITISIGLSKMDINNDEFTFNKWINKSLNFMLNVKNNENGGNDIFSDIYNNNIQFNNNHTTITTNNNDKNTENDSKLNELSYELGSEESFKLKGKEISRKEDSNWILVLIDADNIGMFININLCFAIGNCFFF